MANNAKVMADAIELYAKPGQIVIDVTYGKGAFWNNVDTTQFDFRPSDLQTGVDFRYLPYESYSVDIAVLDPPYMNGSSAPIVIDIDKGYKNNERGSVGELAVNQLYFDGMLECHRVLKRGGYLFVKCMDQVESGKQRWQHVIIYEFATRQLGMIGKDLFVVARTNVVMRHTYQRHARKNHSYLWIFRKK